MKCPYCDTEMKLGYLQCRDSMVWDSKKRMVAALPSLRNDSIVLGSGDGPFSGASVLAHNCDKCKKSSLIMPPNISIDFQGYDAPCRGLFIEKR